jgi:hypothetical protein
MNKAEKKPHRQICALCNEISRVDFWVPDEIWKSALHKSQLNSIICLECFTRLADERSVEWDKEIKFYPISWTTHYFSTLHPGQVYKFQKPLIRMKQKQNDQVDNVFSKDLKDIIIGINDVLSHIGSELDCGEVSKARDRAVSILEALRELPFINKSQASQEDKE